MSIEGDIRKLQEEKQDTGGIRQVYFVACGGSLGAFYPAKYFLETQSNELRTGLYNSNEFVHQPPAALSVNSLVVVASHSGNTPETVKAAAIAKERGASVIALAYPDNTPVEEYADLLLHYTFGPDKDIAEEKTMQGLRVAVELLYQSEGYVHYDDFQAGVKLINGIVKRAENHVKKRAQAFAEAHRDDKVIYTMGSGAGYGAAYMESICIFMEMQWINSSSIHTGEYFHGPFEITDAEIPFIIQISEGATRPLDERALSFLRQYAKRIEVLDAKELGLSPIPPTVIDYFNHSLFSNVYGVYNEALAEVRQHPLSTRRYMWKVAY